MKNSVLVSACLLGKNCRYDGNNSYEKLLDELDIDWIPVCPEEQGGLGTPRHPSELQDRAGEIIKGTGKITSILGEDVTPQFIKGAMECLQLGKSNQVKTAILKSKSPSCGVDQVYDGSFSRKLQEGEGVFAYLCAQSGIKCISSENISEIKKIIPKQK